MTTDEDPRDVLADEIAGIDADLHLRRDLTDQDRADLRRLRDLAIDRLRRIDAVNRPF